MDHREKKYKAHRQFGDRRGGVISARTYFYADEAKCDNHMETFINCIKASGERNFTLSSVPLFCLF